ncbi:hypothetical protein DFS33DRAFT_1358270 [Desarmillaria ectypa]|nr:hypothetical protein DFS33DRAFT_1358270 [Desarmillaria ectypa]
MITIYPFLITLYFYDLVLTQTTVPMIHSIHFSYLPIICTLLRLRIILYIRIKRRRDDNTIRILSSLLPPNRHRT